jgi:hypothetical protein
MNSLSYLILSISSIFKEETLLLTVTKNDIFICRSLFAYSLFYLYSLLLLLLQRFLSLFDSCHSLLLLCIIITF